MQIMAKALRIPTRRKRGDGTPDVGDIDDLSRADKPSMIVAVIKSCNRRPKAPGNSVDHVGYFEELVVVSRMFHCPELSYEPETCRNGQW